MGLPLVDAIGDQIERMWSAQDYDSSRFPEICVHALADARLSEQLTVDQILNWTLEARLPQQADPKANFGQPPITLYRARRFHISALFWVDGTTSVHDHSFSGAFQVLSGSSIETLFAFESRRNIGDHLRFGDLNVLETCLLRQGDIRPILAGPSLIHSLFHLPRPAVSLVVRTYGAVSAAVQLRYLPPGIAHNPFHIDETLDRLVQVVGLLRATDDPAFEDRVGGLITRTDLHTAFTLLRACITLPNRAQLARLIDRVSDVGARDLFRAWSESAERISFLQSRRAMVHEPDLRFMLAVLLNAHRRQDALTLVAAHTPAPSPARTIATCLAKLAKVTARLQLASGPWEPNLLGLPPITARLEDVLAAELAGQREARDDDEAAFLDKLRALPSLLPLFR